MTNDRIPMTNKAPMTNDQLGDGIWCLIGHWLLAISPWCLVICWSLALGHFSVAQEIRLRKAPPRGTDSTATPNAGAPNIVRGDEITPRQKDAVEKGLVWLSNHQAKDGAYGGDGMGKHAGITGLAGLAFMQAGNLPNRGKYGENVNKCVDFVLASSQESG